MPETPTLPPSQSQAESPGKKTMRRYYEGRLVEELMQATSMAQNRAMLRRGARKMQDGTLNQPGEPAEEEPVNISIGDTVYHAAQSSAAGEVPAKSASPAASGALAKIGLAAALLAGGAVAGVAVPWLAGWFTQKPAAEAGEDTWIELRLTKPEAAK